MNGERFYRALLRLYPQPFRRRYGAAMTEIFVDLRHHSRTSGLRFWSFIVSDTIRSAAIQHLDVWTSVSPRVAIRWLLACVVGTVLCNLAGGVFLWAFEYLYHPYLEGTTFLPSAYGALIGATLGTTQSFMFTRMSERATWILVSALSTAVGWEFAIATAGATSLDHGVVIGATVATAQWLTLRGRMRRPSAAALISSVAVGTAAVAGAVAVTRSLAGFNALGASPGTASITIEAVLRGFYTPMDWTQCVVAVAATAVAGLLLGAITLKPASSLFARAH